MLDDTTALGTDCRAKCYKESVVSRLQHLQGLSAVQSVFIDVAGEYTLQNAELLSSELFSFISALPLSVQNSVEFFELLQEQLLCLHWFLSNVAEETKVYLLDFNVRQILAKYVALHRETAQTKVTRLLWIVYCTYFRYQTGVYNSLGVCRLILKFLQSIRTTSSHLKNYFVEIEKKFLKAATVDAAKYQNVPCFCLKPSQVSTVTVVDLTADDSTETPEDLKYQAALDRLKKLRNDLEAQRKQPRRNGLITRTNLKRNTVICISDDENDVIDVEAERNQTSERNIKEAISEATDLLTKYSNREMTIKVQKDEVRIQIQSPESASSESSRSPVEEPECPQRTLIWPYCYAPPFQTMQSWFGYHPGDGRAYPRPLLDPWRNPMAPPPQWFQPYPIIESAVHRVGNFIDSYPAPYWSYGRQHVESPDLLGVPDHKPLIIEKEDKDEKMDSPPPEKTTQTCKQPDKEPEQVVQKPEEKPPDEDLLLLSDPSDGYSETEVDEDALLEDIPQQPEPPTNEESQPKEPGVLIIQDVVIKTAVQEENEPEAQIVEETVEPLNQTVIVPPPPEIQSETVYAPDQTEFPEGAPPELPEARNNLLWFSNVILSSTVPEPEEAAKEDQMSAFVHPEMVSSDTILAPEDVVYSQEIEVEETVQNTSETEFYRSKEPSENILPPTDISTLKPAKVPETYIQSPTENKLLPNPGFSLLRYESGEAQRPETTDSSDSEIRLKIDERGNSSPEHPLVTPVRPYRTKAEMKQGIQSDESDDDIPLKFHKGTKPRNRRPSSSPRGRKRNGSARRKTESQHYTSKLRSRSQSTSKEEEPSSLENVAPAKPRGRPKKVPPPVSNPPEPTTLIETVLVTSKTLLVEESCATLNLATTPPKKRMALLRKMNKLLDDTTKRLKERQGVLEEEEMFTFDSAKILEVQQEVEIVMSDKKAEGNDRVLRSSKEFEVQPSEECVSLKKTPEVPEKSKLSQKIKSPKNSGKVEFLHPDSSSKQLGGKKTKKSSKSQKNDSADSFCIASELDGTGKKSKKALHSQIATKNLDSVITSKHLDDFTDKPDQVSQKIKPPRTSSKSPSRMQSPKALTISILDGETSDTSKALYKSLKKSKNGANNEVLTTETVKSSLTDEQQAYNHSKKLDEAFKTTKRSPDSLVKSPRSSVNLDLDASGINSKQVDELTNKPTKETDDHSAEKIKLSKSFSKLDEALKKSSKSSNNQIVDNECDKSLTKSPTLLPGSSRSSSKSPNRMQSLDLEASKSSVKLLEKSRRGSNDLTIECLKIKDLENTLKSRRSSTNQIVEQESIRSTSPSLLALTLPEESSSRRPRRSNSLTVENKVATISSKSESTNLEGSKKLRRTSNCQSIEIESVEQEGTSSTNKSKKSSSKQIEEKELVKTSIKMEPSILSNNSTVDLKTTETSLKHLEKTSKKSRRPSNNQSMDYKPEKVSRKSPSQMQPFRTSNKLDSSEINSEDKSSNSQIKESAPEKTISDSPTDLESHSKAYEDTKSARNSSESKASKKQTLDVETTESSLLQLGETLKNKSERSADTLMEKEQGKSRVQTPKTANHKKASLEPPESDINQEVGSKQSKKPLNQNVPNERTKKSRRSCKHFERSELKESSKKTTLDGQEASTSNFRQVKEVSTNQIFDNKPENNSGLEASVPDQCLKKSRKSLNNLTVHFELPELDLSGKKIKPDVSSKNRVKPSCDFKQSDESLNWSNGELLPEKQKINKELLDTSNKKSKRSKEHTVINSTDEELTKKPSNNHTIVSDTKVTSKKSTELKNASKTETVKAKQSKSSRSKSSKRAASDTKEDLAPVKKSKKNKEDDIAKPLDGPKNTQEVHSKLHGSVKKSRNTSNKEAAERKSDDTAKIEEEPKLDVANKKSRRSKEVKGCEVQSQENQSNNSSNLLEEHSKPLDVSEKMTTTVVECSDQFETVETPDVQSEKTVGDSLKSHNVEEIRFEQLEDLTCKKPELHTNVNEASKSSEVLKTPEAELGEKDALKGDTKEEDSEISSEQLKDLTKTPEEPPNVPLEIDATRVIALTSGVVEETEEQNKNTQRKEESNVTVVEQLEDLTGRSEEIPNIPLQIEEVPKLSLEKSTSVQKDDLLDGPRKSNILDEETSFDSTRPSKESEKTPNISHLKAEEEVPKKKPTKVKRELQTSAVIAEVQLSEKDTTNNKKMDESRVACAEVQSGQLDDSTKGSEEIPDIHLSTEEELSRSKKSDSFKKKSTKVKDNSKSSKELLNTAITPEVQVDESKQEKEDSSLAKATKSSEESVTTEEHSKELAVRKKKSTKVKDNSTSSKELLNTTITPEVQLDEDMQEKEDSSLAKATKSSEESVTTEEPSKELAVRKKKPTKVKDNSKSSKELLNTAITPEVQLDENIQEKEDSSLAIAKTQSGQEATKSSEEFVTTEEHSKELAVRKKKSTKVKDNSKSSKELLNTTITPEVQLDESKQEKEDSSLAKATKSSEESVTTEEHSKELAVRKKKSTKIKDNSKSSKELLNTAITPEVQLDENMQEKEDSSLAIAKSQATKSSEGSVTTEEHSKEPAIRKKKSTKVKDNSKSLKELLNTTITPEVQLDENMQEKEDSSLAIAKTQSGQEATKRSEESVTTEEHSKELAVRKKKSTKVKDNSKSSKELLNTAITPEVQLDENMQAKEDSSLAKATKSSEESVTTEEPSKELAVRRKKSTKVKDNSKSSKELLNTTITPEVQLDESKQEKEDSSIAIAKTQATKSSEESVTTEEPSKELAVRKKKSTRRKDRSKSSKECKGEKEDSSVVVAESQSGQLKSPTKEAEEPENIPPTTKEDCSQSKQLELSGKESTSVEEIPKSSKKVSPEENQDTLNSTRKEESNIPIIKEVEDCNLKSEENVSRSKSKKKSKKVKETLEVKTEETSNSQEGETVSELLEGSITTSKKPEETPSNRLTEEDLTLSKQFTEPKKVKEIVVALEDQTEQLYFSPKKETLNCPKKWLVHIEDTQNVSKQLKEAPNNQADAVESLTSEPEVQTNQPEVLNKPKEVNNVITQEENQIETKLESKQLEASNKKSKRLLEVKIEAISVLNSLSKSEPTEQNKKSRRVKEDPIMKLFEMPKESSALLDLKKISLNTEDSKPADVPIKKSRKFKDELHRDHSKLKEDNWSKEEVPHCQIETEIDLSSNIILMETTSKVPPSKLDEFSISTSQTVETSILKTSTIKEEIVKLDSRTPEKDEGSDELSSTTLSLNSSHRRPSFEGLTRISGLEKTLEESLKQPPTSKYLEPSTTKQNPEQSETSQVKPSGEIWQPVFEDIDYVTEEIVEPSSVPMDLSVVKSTENQSPTKTKISPKLHTLEVAQLSVDTLKGASEASKPLSLSASSKLGLPESLPKTTKKPSIEETVLKLKQQICKNTTNIESSEQSLITESEAQKKPITNTASEALDADSETLMDISTVKSELSKESEELKNVIQEIVSEIVERVAELCKTLDLSITKDSGVLTAPIENLSESSHNQKPLSTPHSSETDTNSAQNTQSPSELPGNKRKSSDSSTPNNYSFKSIVDLLKLDTPDSVVDGLSESFDNVQPVENSANPEVFDFDQNLAPTSTEVPSTLEAAVDSESITAQQQVKEEQLKNTELDEQQDSEIVPSASDEDSESCERNMTNAEPEFKHVTAECDDTVNFLQYDTLHSELSAVEKANEPSTVTSERNQQQENLESASLAVDNASECAGTSLERLNAQKKTESSGNLEVVVSCTSVPSKSLLDQLKEATNEKVEKTSDSFECLAANPDSATESSEPLENAQKPAQEEDSMSFSEISELTSSENSMHPIECLVPDFDNELLITDDSMSQDPLKISDVLNEVEVSSVVLNEDTVWIPKVQVEFLPQIPYEVRTEQFEEVKPLQPIHKVEEGLKAGKELQLPSPNNSRKKKKRRRSEDRQDRRREDSRRADKDCKDRKSEKKEESSKEQTEKKSSRSEHKKDREVKRDSSKTKESFKELKKSRSSDKLDTSKTEEVSKKIDSHPHDNQRKRKKEDPERSDRSDSKKAKTSSSRDSKEVKKSAEHQESAKKSSNKEHRSSKSNSKEVQKKRDKRDEPKSGKPKVKLCTKEKVPKTEILKGITAVGNILDDTNTKVADGRKSSSEDPQPESSLDQSAAQIEETKQEDSLVREKIEIESPNPAKKETQVTLDVSAKVLTKEDIVADQPIDIQEEFSPVCAEGATMERDEAEYHPVKDNKVECHQSGLNQFTVQEEPQTPLGSNDFPETATIDQLDPLEDLKFDCPDVVQGRINIINHTIIKPANLVTDHCDIAKDPVGATMISPGDLMDIPITPAKRKCTESLETSSIKKVKPNEELQSNECVGLSSEYITDLKSTQSNQPCLDDTKILMEDDCLQSYLFLDENGCSFSGITETVASSSVPFVDFAFDHVTTDTSSESYTPHNPLGECEITNFVTTTLSQNPNTEFDVFKASSDHSYADAVKSQDNLSEVNAKKMTSPDIDSKPSMDQLIGLLQPSAEDVLEKVTINMGDNGDMEYENNWSEGLDLKTLENYMENSTSKYSVLENFSLEDELEAEKNSDMFIQVEKFVQVMGIDKDDFEIGLPQKNVQRNEPFTPIDIVTFEQPKELTPKPVKSQVTCVTAPLRMSTRNIPHKQISVRPLQDLITKKTSKIPDNYMEDSNTSESSCSVPEIGFVLDSGPHKRHFNTQVSPSTTPKNPSGRKRPLPKPVQPKTPPVLTVPVRVSEKTKPCPPPPKKKVTSPHIQPNSPRVHRSMNSYMSPLVEDASGASELVKTRTRKSPKGSPRGTTVKSMPTLTVDEPVSVKPRFGTRTAHVKISGATDNASSNWDQTLKLRQKRQVPPAPEPIKTPPIVDAFDLLKNGLINPSFEERLRASQGRDQPAPPVVEKPYTSSDATSKPLLANKPNQLNAHKTATNQKQSSEEDWRERFAEELKKRGRSESCL